MSPAPLLGRLAAAVPAYDAAYAVGDVVRRALEHFAYHRHGVDPGCGRIARAV